MGSTFEPTGLYRFNAAMRWRSAVGLTAASGRDHVHALQTQFIAGLKSSLFDASQLVVPVSDPNRGQFLTFKTPRGHEISTKLKAAQVVTDVRDDRLRFGFGVAQSSAMVAALLTRVAALT